MPPGAGKRVAFYAPMKPPHHPVPSGDREIARNLMGLFSSSGTDVQLVSDLRIYDKHGSTEVQATLRQCAEAETERLIREMPEADLWVTYHNYYKAPDLIGPAVAGARGIPYAQIESTRARKRLTGPWAGFAQAAEAACDAAQVIFYLTANDLITLKRHKVTGQRLIHLPPFLPAETLPEASDCSGPMLTAGMMRAGDKLASFRVIADHLRTSAFLIADGVLPSNEGRGYVLRRIMRRAMRHGHLLGAREPVMHKLTPALISEMGEAYPELGRAKAAIEAALEQEEARFQRTLGNGLSLLEKETETLKAGAALPGETAFKLYDTYGFPLDLTQDILRARGMTVDVDAFDAAMEVQREGSRAAGFASGDQATDEIWFRVRDKAGATKFTGYGNMEGSGKLVAIAAGGALADTLSPGPAELVFDTTPFYAESGGQAGDHGEIVFEGGARFIVRDVQKRAGDVHVHIGELVSGTAKTGAKAQLHVDAVRRKAVMANHSATHLMHAALRKVLGEHVTQKGSLVEADRLRFDFSHGGPLSAAEIEAVEDEVNAQIRANMPTGIQVTSPEKAIEAGALALFGEKYGDEVRVLSMGTGDDRRYSVELCGGTHVERAGDIAVFVITSESGVSAGVRRIEAATGAEALAYLKGRAQIGADIADSLKVPLKDLPKRVATLGEEKRNLERELAEAKRKLAMGGGGGTPAGPEEINGVKLLARVAEGVGGKDLRALVDEAKTQIGSGIVAFVGVADGKAGVAVGVTKDLTDKFSAVDLVKAASEAVGGKGGGGRPDMAMAGGPDGSKAEDALNAVRAILKG